ncbi:PLP-dependent cysteine synthase family protein [Alkaliphilus crotonatoxidans]
MKKVVESIAELIGNTPVLKLCNFNLPAHVEVYAKLEMFNPGFSIKDRPAYHMLTQAERQGHITEGTTIIEATSGNTGIGLAMAAAQKGYPVIICIPERYSMEKQMIMEALGAKIVNTPYEKGTDGAVAKAKELVQSIENAYMPNQFENNDNSQAHYLTTGPELYHQLDGNIDIFVAGVGSGGTFSGTMKYLKEQNPNIKGVIADPISSVIGGGEPQLDIGKIEGIGNLTVPQIMNLSLVDEVEKISYEEALTMAREIAKKEGVLGGLSSGAAMVAVLRQAAKATKPVKIAVIFPDSADRYMSAGIYHFTR